MARVTIFSNWRFDQPIAPGTFAFQPPPGSARTADFTAELMKFRNLFPTGTVPDASAAH
jgi:hypothetical protein